MTEYKYTVSHTTSSFKCCQSSVGSKCLGGFTTRPLGDPLAMAMYSISVTPLIASLQDPHVAQVWFADDATAGGTLWGLHDWWCKLKDLGFMYGYFPNAAKTSLIVKPERLDEAKQQFAGTGVSITVEGKRHLGAALGSRAFTEAYITEKVESWSRCVRRLVNIAKTHPHAAYAAFTHGLCSKWTYFVRTIPAISSLLEPLEDIISLQLLPALTGRSISDVERALFSLLLDWVVLVSVIPNLILMLSLILL